MPPTSLAKRVVTLGLCSILLGGSGWAKKPAPDPLAPTRARLDALQSCLGASDALKTLRKGLLWGWGKESGPPTLLDKHPAPPGPEYSESLDTDVKACQAASQIQEQEKKQLALNTIRKDIEIKAEDCRKFGMSRKVPVIISTVRGDKVESGWQVFYKWSCASLLEPQEIRAPQLTSPANVELPPGVYSFRAEKKNGGGQVETVAATEIVVGSAQWIPLELVIP